jgi:hypothetical protein
MDEIWKDIKGFEGRYQVSNMGRVRSLDRDIVTTYRGTVHTRHYKGKILAFKKSVPGYYYVVLADSGVHAREAVHRLVAMAFVDGYKDGSIVNHKNCIKTDNRAENLEWCDYTYNNTYGDQFVRRYDKRKMPCYRLEPTGIVTNYESIQDAARKTGHPATVIIRWCKQNRPNQEGDIWKLI